MTNKILKIDDLIIRSFDLYQDSKEKIKDDTIFLKAYTLTLEEAIRFIQEEIGIDDNSPISEEIIRMNKEGSSDIIDLYIKTYNVIIREIIINNSSKKDLLTLLHYRLKNFIINLSTKTEVGI